MKIALNVEETRTPFGIGYKSGLLDNAYLIEGDAIAFLRNKYNLVGWSLYKLSDFDESWLLESGIALENVFRTVSGNNHIAIVKINFETGTYGFIDNDYYEKTGDLRFEAMRRARKIIRHIV